VKQLGLFGFLALLIFTPLVTSQEENQLHDIAWINTAQELWLAGIEAEPMLVATNATHYPLFSPAGTHLAYLSEEGARDRLFILNVAVPEEVIEVTGLPSESGLTYLQWQDENSLWLNTYQKANLPEAAFSSTDWDLWHISLDPLTVEPVIDQRGAAFPSPDGTKTAILYPGRYGEIPGSISILDSERNLLGSMEFPAISSGTYLDYLPPLVWHEDGLRVALPNPDLIYNSSEPLPTRLIEFNPTDGQIELGEVTFQALYWHFVWSPDGTQIAYLDPQQDNTVIIRDLSSGEQTSLDSLGSSGRLYHWQKYLIYANLELNRAWQPDGTTLESRQGELFGLAYTRNGKLLIQTAAGISFFGGEQLLTNATGDILFMAAGIYEQ
jgi:WD40 repeat protein